MKTFLLSIFILASAFMFGQNDYNIQIDNQVLDIALDQEYQITIKGKQHTLKVSAKDTLTYQGKLFSFKHSKDYKVTKTAIDSGIDQQMIMAADGTGLAIQQYHNFDPTMLNEMMMAEVTKESLSYGYEMERQDYERKLSSGHDITVNRAVLKYKGDTNIYEIASLGNKDEGIIILTMKMDDNQDSEGQKVIDTMWETLWYK